MSFAEDRARAEARKDALRFHGKAREVTRGAWQGQDAPASEVQVYHDGEDSFCFKLRPDRAFDVSVWTTEEGLQAIVEACGAALTRARIAREQLEAAEAELLEAVRS